MSRVEGFNELFLDEEYTPGSYYNPIPGADSFNEPLNWDTGT